MLNMRALFGRGWEGEVLTAKDDVSIGQMILSGPTFGISISVSRWEV